MGGDHLHFFPSEDESSSLDNDFHQEYPSCASSFYRMSDEDESSITSFELVSKEFDDVDHWLSSNPVEFDCNLRRRKIAYNEIMRNYDELWVRTECLYQAKSRILSYTPGSWINNAGSKKLSNYVIPKTTTLLLVGPKGSGKSSLVNRISRVFEDDKFASERAQVTYNPSTGEGTYFLQEYMIPRCSSLFCLFDTRSFSDDLADNFEMIQHWMTKGVRHGELIIRDSDTSSLKMSLKCKAQQSGTPDVIRKVNFVIFAVNGFQVLGSMNSDKKEDRRYMEMVIRTFSFPYLSFKDDKPVIVVTHGDLLSLGDRARVRVYLGEKLGVPPAKQIFDIPDNSHPSTELTILDMIRYSLEHADKNIPCKESRDWVDRSTFSVDGVKDKVSGTPILTLMLVAVLLGIACVVFPMHQSNKRNKPLVASAISWPSKSEVNYPHEPYDPLMTFPSNSESKSSVNHSPENREPQATSAPTLPSKSLVTTSDPTLPSKSVVSTSEPALPLRPILATSEPTLPSKSAVSTSGPTLPLKPVSAKSEPTFSSKSVVDYPQKRESRSPSPRNRHPNSAVKWHKIRHLWLDSD